MRRVANDAFNCLSEGVLDELSYRTYIVLLESIFVAYSDDSKRSRLTSLYLRCDWYECWATVTDVWKKVASVHSDQNLLSEAIKFNLS